MVRIQQSQILQIEGKTCYSLFLWLPMFIGIFCLKAYLFNSHQNSVSWEEQGYRKTFQYISGYVWSFFLGVYGQSLANLNFYEVISNSMPILDFSEINNIIHQFSHLIINLIRLMYNPIFLLRETQIVLQISTCKLDDNTHKANTTHQSKTSTNYI